MDHATTGLPDSLTLPSGRTLAWTIFGGPLYAADAAANPAVIFYFHGFPGSRREAAFLSTNFLRERHARCIAIDRPGMGESSHDPNRRILDWPADVLAVADHLGIDAFYILAASGGAPYGLACAKEIPFVGEEGAGHEPQDGSVAGDASSSSSAAAAAGPASTSTEGRGGGGGGGGGGRLRGVAIVSGAYPTSLGLQGMLRGPRNMFRAGAWLPRMATGALLDWNIGRIARDYDHPAALENLFDGEMALRPESERRAVADPLVREAAIAAMRDSFRQGAEGVATDLMLVSGDWGFALSQVHARGVRLWHGKLDQNVPFAMAEKAADLMPEASRHFKADEGHLGLPVRYLEDIFADLLGEDSDADES